MAGESRSAVRDDGVEAATRVLSVVIVPFLLAAFVVLYGFPDRTSEWFAWGIDPPMTAMTLGAVYLGGAYFFVSAARARAWHAIRTGFVAVGTFATTMGVATIVHWGRFTHDHVAFWLWAGLYFTTPFLVWGAWAANQRRARPAAPGEAVLTRGGRRALAATGALAVVTGAFCLLWPARAIDVWPWALTPLTSRVVGAILLLGVAALGVLADPRWTATRLLLRVEVVMLSLILVAAVRARDDFDTANPLTWVLLGGFLASLVGAAVLSRRGSPPPAAAPLEAAG